MLDDLISRTILENLAAMHASKKTAICAGEHDE